MTEPQPLQPHHATEAVTLWAGDCLDVMRTMPDASVDAVVTDPPYLLGFMGKAWDTKAAHEHLTFHGAWAAECLRVLKPGGHLLAFGGTRTWHRLACAVEDAGFEIRDSIAWMYGSGFPKSLDVSKAIDKARTEDLAPAAAVARWLVDRMDERGVTRRQVSDHFDAANAAQQWTTWWTDKAVKPRVPRWEQWQELRRWLDLSDDMDAEVWRLNGRKGKPGDNFGLREVVGAKQAGMGSGQTFGMLQSEGRNGEGPNVVDITAPATPDAERWQGWGTALKPAHEPIVVARTPLAGTVAANVLTHGTGALNVDGCRVGTEVLPEMTAGQARIGTFDRGVMVAPERTGRWPANVILDESQAEALDAQAAEVSRFYYVAKASRTERPRVNGVAHPTVKPLTLMRWLVRLVTPPGGIVLDPFTGSGTTVEACLAEGLRCVGIEADPDYLPLVLARIDRHAEPPTARAGTP